MARDTNPVNEHETSPAGQHLKRGSKDPAALATVSAEKEAKKEKKRKRTKERTPHDTKDATTESKHKKRKKGKGDKLLSAENRKYGKTSTKDRIKPGDQLSGRRSTASTQRPDDARDTAVINGGPEQADAQENREQLSIRKKKKRKEKKLKKSSKEDSQSADDNSQTKKETREKDSSDKGSKPLKKEKKKKKESSRTTENRQLTAGRDSLAISETSDDAPTPTANGPSGTDSSADAAVANVEKYVRRANATEEMASVQNGQHDDQMDTIGSLPSVGNILKRASQKRNGYLHGLAAIPLLSAEQVCSLDKNGRHGYVRKSAALCHQLVHLMHDTIVKGNEWIKVERSGDFVDIEEALTRDMARFSSFPIARQYVSMTLWRRIQQMTRDHLLASSKIGFGKGCAETGTDEDQGLALHREGDPDAEFVSYKEAYMADLVEQHQRSLDTLREREQMDETRVRFLLRCLDAGSSLAANLKCMEKNIEHEKVQPGDSAIVKKTNETKTRRLG